MIISQQHIYTLVIWILFWWVNYLTDLKIIVHFAQSGANLICMKNQPCNKAMLAPKIARRIWANGKLHWFWRKNKHFVAIFTSNGFSCVASIIIIRTRSLGAHINQCQFQSH